MSDAIAGIGFISRWIARAERSVGATTLLLGIVGFAVGGLAAGPVVGAFVALVVFGLFGTLEVTHVKANAELQRRATRIKEPDLFWAISKKHPTWKPKLVKELAHGGIYFNAIGFEQLPMALEISEPLCPACKGRLVERAKVKFPGRARIEFICGCGFVTKSDFTLAELAHEVATLAAVPGD